MDNVESAGENVCICKNYTGCDSKCLYHFGGDCGCNANDVCYFHSIKWERINFENVLKDSETTTEQEQQQSKKK